MLLMNVKAGVLGSPLLKVWEWKVHSLSFARGGLRVSLIQLTVFRQETRYRNKQFIVSIGFVGAGKDVSSPIC